MWHHSRRLAGLLVSALIALTFAVPSSAAGSKVSGITATAASATSAAISWNAHPGAVRYRIYHSPSSSMPSRCEPHCTVVTPKDVQNPAHTVSGLRTGGTYWIKISAIDASGRTITGWQSSGVRVDLARVTGIAATPASERSLDVSWDRYPGAVRYRIYHSPTASMPSRCEPHCTVVAPEDQSAPSFMLDDLEPGGTSWIKISAINSSGRTITGWQSEPVRAALTVGSCDDLNDPAKRRLTFGDDFDGTAVDTGKWRVRDRTYLSFDAAYILGDNVEVADGTLTIKGRREAEPFRVRTGEPERWFSTGYIDTIDRFSQRYGRWEMRAKLPTDSTQTRGVWPAFWLRANETGGEIDVMESYGEPAVRTPGPSRDYQVTMFEDTMSGFSKGSWHRNRAHSDKNPLAAPVYEDFHTYGVNWMPGCVQFTFDETVMHEVDLAELPWTDSAFDSTFNIRLNMQVGSSYWGMPTETETKDAFDYVIDHVRVYDLDR